MSDSSPRPTSDDDRDGWKAYWEALGQPWRTEPEIPIERQAELARHRDETVVSIEEGIYPFGGFSLTRADVEWLLANHQGGQGPIAWSEEVHYEFEENDQYQVSNTGIDLRSADFRSEQGSTNLAGLPLARVQCGLTIEDWLKATAEQREMASAHLERVNLKGSHLEGANLSSAHLEGAVLSGTHLDEANLSSAHLEGAVLSGVHLERANLYHTYLKGADFNQPHFEGANLSGVHLENALLYKPHLEGAYLIAAHLEGANLIGAHLEGADLSEAYLEQITLSLADELRQDIRQMTANEFDYLIKKNPELITEMMVPIEIHLEGASLIMTYLTRVRAKVRRSRAHHDQCRARVSSASACRRSSHR